MNPLHSILENDPINDGNPTIHYNHVTLLFLLLINYTTTTNIHHHHHYNHVTLLL